LSLELLIYYITYKKTREGLASVEKSGLYLLIGRRKMIVNPIKKRRVEKRLTQ